MIIIYLDLSYFIHYIFCILLYLTQVWNKTWIYLHLVCDWYRRYYYKSIEPIFWVYRPSIISKTNITVHAVIIKTTCEMNGTDWLLLTLISPSAEPETKNSSLGSRERHLTAESWAWNLCCRTRWRTSMIAAIVNRTTTIFETYCNRSEGLCTNVLQCSS